MSSGSPKQAIFARLAEIAQALGHAHRLELLEHLGQGERSVEDLSDRTRLSFANTSRHLQILRRARLADGRREGKWVLYGLAGAEDVVPLLRALGRVGERNTAEVQQVLSTYFRARDELEPVSREDLIQRLRDGLAIVLDVRPEDEFGLGHLPGAVSVPLAALGRRLAELPRDQEIVAYCRGPYCVFAIEAVSILRAHGFHARRLEDGFPEWRAAGLPTESGAALCT
ncbi:MAG TPA: metalloregulator ArsR/SmtB family transcription factor [Roseiarcus sp.]|nr:metalloregulator ArsR/SmtB family transcription factor [Roseiarcus sp.]